MNFSIIENIILNLILILFPLLLYLVLVCNDSNHITAKIKNVLLNLALLSSLYLCLKYGIKEENNKIMLFCNIPIVIAYMKKQTLSGILLSIINIVYCYVAYDTLYLITIIKYISYLLLYLCANKKRLSTGGFILSVAVLQGYLLSFEYFIIETKI